jgi:hypothetical protein
MSFFLLSKRSQLYGYLKTKAHYGDKGRGQQVHKGENFQDKKHNLINPEYVMALFQEYLPNNDETKAFILSQRIINEYEIEIFAKIRKLCSEETTTERNESR